MSAISFRGWACVGREEDLSPGAYLRAPLTPAGILVTRSDQGLGAYHAVCTHRGSALFDADAPEEGSTSRFACPYHGARFDLAGRPCSPLGGPLRSVRLDTWRGFVFVDVGGDAPRLADALGETPPWLDGVCWERLRRARRVAYDVAASWEIVIANFQESLHFAAVHPALEALTPAAGADTWRPEAGPWLGGIMPIAAHAETVSRSTRRMGRPFIVPPEDRRFVHDAMCFPNLLTSLQPDYLLTFLVFPQGDTRTRIVAATYVDEGAPDEALLDVFEFWSQVYDEDRLACERQQRGLLSVPSLEPRYAEVEDGVVAFERMIRPASGQPQRHHGILGRPYLDLSSLIDTSGFAAMHEEITRGLSAVDVSYTGGSLKWMGVCAPWVMNDGYRDLMHAVRAMSRAELEELVALGDDDDVDLDDPELAFGDETDHPLTWTQMRFLETRHGVYFPWKVCYHLLENDRWEDKHSGSGKSFTKEARLVFPKTVAFIESLPFTEIGRVVLFGVQPNDHAPAHRDTEPGKAEAIAQSISFQPGGRKKRFYVLAPDGSNPVVVDAPVYWFNDMDWHGVLADPYFRYSIRADGSFDPTFVERLRHPF